MLACFDSSWKSRLIEFCKLLARILLDSQKTTPVTWWMHFRNTNPQALLFFLQTHKLNISKYYPFVVDPVEYKLVQTEQHKNDISLTQAVLCSSSFSTSLEHIYKWFYFKGIAFWVWGLFYFLKFSFGTAL